MAEYIPPSEEVFLQQSPRNDRWCCPGCETEHERTVASCFICGCTQQQWYAEQERLRQESMRQISNPTPSPVAETANKENWVRIMAAVLIILAIILVVVAAANAAEPEEEAVYYAAQSEMEECNSDL